MNPDFLSMLVVGAAALFAIDAACYLWLRSNAARFDRHLGRVEQIANSRVPRPRHLSAGTSEMRPVRSRGGKSVTSFN
jgi:hypothetical protein